MELEKLLINLDSSQKDGWIMAQKVKGRFTHESEAITCRAGEIVIGMDFFQTTDGAYQYLRDCVDDPHNQADVKDWAIELIEEVNNGDGA